MSTDNILGSKPSKNFDQTHITGALPVLTQYVGIVKHNVDPTRAGRLKVWIPDFTGKPDEEANWITVRYASPFMGMSRQGGVSAKSDINDYTHTNHSYGMWFTPPDIGNYVLVTFIAGDINRGYWFACILPELSQFAMPGQAGSVGNQGNAPFVDQNLNDVLTNPPYPTVEFNEDNEELKKQWNDFLLIKKPIHEHQAKILLRQGLEDDKTRGVISSSSQRESPSRVFGISTPGAPSPEKNKTTGSPLYRLGGHTLVMDDGDAQGVDQMIRLRTAGGHQIMMNDDADVLYIANSKGTVWMEFTADGQMHVYTESNINFRAKGNINLHSDKNVNITAERKINMWAKGNSKIPQDGTINMQAEKINVKATKELSQYGKIVGISSGSTLGLQASTIGSFGSGDELVFGSGKIFINEKPAPLVTPPPSIPQKVFKDTIATKPAPYYKYQQIGQISSISDSEGMVLPTHEPWTTHHPTAASQKTGSSGAQPTATSAVTTPNSGDSAGPAMAQGKGVTRPASAADYAAQPPNTTGIGSLTAEEVTALKTQISKSESGGNYAAENQLGYLGKYQFGALALTDQKYIKSGTSNKGMSNPSAWTGKDGITSKESYWAAHDVQESIMDANLAANYKTLLRLGTISASSPADDVAGKLAVAHLLGAGGCNSWAKGKGGADANGTTGDTYYQRGRYAIIVLAKGGKTDTTS